MRTLLLGLLLMAGQAFAQVYSYIDSGGNRVFTDQPPDASAEPLEITPGNQFQSGMSPPPLRKLRPPADTPAVYSSLSILSPPADAVITGGEGALQVSVDSQPGLFAGHSYRLLLDGQALEQAGSGPLFNLSNLDRGTHQLAIEIVDGNGRSLARSAEQPVHIKRTSLIQKRMVNPCKLSEYGRRPECPLRDKPEIDNDIPFIPFF
jgi:hypothetical protein